MSKIPDSVKLIDEHLSDFIEDDNDIFVLHEKKSEIIHCDIYVVKANEDRPFTMVLSCGMSALPMAVPEAVDAPSYAEVMMLLPPDWKLSQEALADERNYWPVRILKELSKLPHTEKTWLGYGHTYTHDAEFAEGVGFSGVILLNSVELSEDFTLIDDEEKTVQIYSVIPLYKEELDYKIEHGSTKLLELFDRFSVEEIVKPGRPNVCKG